MMMNETIVWSGNRIMKMLIDNEEIKMMVSEKFLRPNNTLGGKSLADFMLQNTMDKLALYRKIFGVERLEKICFETYDVDTELDEFFKRRREVDKSPVPSYCRGFFDDKSNLSCLAIMPMRLIKVGGGIVRLLPMLMRLFIYIIKNMFMVIIE